MRSAVRQATGACPQERPPINADQAQVESDHRRPHDRGARAMRRPRRLRGASNLRGRTFGIERLGGSSFLSAFHWEVSLRVFGNQPRGGLVCRLKTPGAGGGSGAGVVDGKSTGTAGEPLMGRINTSAGGLPIATYSSNWPGCNRGSRWCIGFAPVRATAGC